MASLHRFVIVVSAVTVVGVIHAVVPEFPTRYLTENESLSSLITGNKAQAANNKNIALSVLGTQNSTHIQQQINIENVNINPFKDAQTGQLYFQTVLENPGLASDEDSRLTSTEFSLSDTLQTDVQIAVTGMIARASVTQTFTNNSDEWVNGLYVFPLPENAAVDHLMIQIDDRIIEGQIKEKKEAKAIFEEAKQAGKKASLVEQRRANLFTNNIANIGPGETIIVNIEYQQTLHYINNGYSLRFPLGITPRYAPSNADIEQHETALLTGNTLPNKVEPAENINISVNLNTGTALQNIQSEHHTIHVDTSNSNTYHVSLNQEPVKLHDFVLNWQPELGSTPSSAHFTQFVNGDEYGLIVLYPPLPEEQPLLDREVIFVLDTSGSMAGEALVQAKQALAYAIDDLSTRDKFNIIEFNSHAEILWRKSTFADAQSKMEAFNFISGLTANGGTEMHQALSMALLSEADPELFKQILFITDGSVSNESSLMTLIKDNLHDSRLFTIGIGAAPNSYFMTEAAKSGKGSFTFIGDTAQVKQKMSDLLAKITSPALTDIQLNLKGIKQYQDFEMYPKVIGDLYSSEPLVLTYKQAMNDTHLKALSDESRQANSVTEEYMLVGTYNNAPWYFNSPKDVTNDVDHFAVKQKAKGINVLWAREKIAQLTRDKRDLVSSGSKAYTHLQSPSKERQAQIESAEQEIIQEMTATALEHHIVSQYTSLVAVDIVATKPASLKQAITLPQTATSAQLNILVGSILLFLSLLLYKLPIRNMKQK